MSQNNPCIQWPYHKQTDTDPVNSETVYYNLQDVYDYQVAKSLLF